MPSQVLSLLSTGFVFTWLLFLPFGLWEATARTVMWLTVPAMALMAALLLGCDEASTSSGRSSTREGVGVGRLVWGPAAAGMGQRTHAIQMPFLHDRLAPCCTPRCN